VTSNEGYEGNVSLTVGVTAEGVVTSISYTNLKETPGKGMLCGEPAFMDQFNNRRVTAFALNASGDDSIDGVTGATITSKASVNAVNAALDFFANVIRGE